MRHRVECFLEIKIIFLSRPGPGKVFAGVPKSVGVGFSDVSGGGPTTDSNAVDNARCVVDGVTKFQVNER